MKVRMIICLTLLLSLVGSVAGASSWTAVGGTATIHPSSYSYTSNLIELGYDTSGNLGTIFASFNVTTQNATPGWTTLTAYYYDGGPYASSGYVSVLLYKLDPSSGANTYICSITSVDNNTSGSCTFSSSTFDFANYMYYVYAVIQRSNASAIPRLRGLRIN